VALTDRGVAIAPKLQACALDPGAADWIWYAWTGMMPGALIGFSGLVLLRGAVIAQIPCSVISCPGDELACLCKARAGFPRCQCYIPKSFSTKTCIQGRYGQVLEGVVRLAGRFRAKARG